MTTDSPPSPDSEPPSLPDDVWDRFLADSERDIRATAPKEPSARARIVARRLREEDEFAAAAVRDRPRFGGRPPRVPRRAARRVRRYGAGERPRPEGARIRAVLALAVTVLLTLVLVSPDHAWSLVTGRGWRGSPGPTPTTEVPQDAPQSPEPAPPAPTTLPATPLAPTTGSPLNAAPLNAGPAAPPYARAVRTVAFTAARAFPAPGAPRPR